MNNIITRHRNFCEIDLKPQTAFFTGYRTKKLLKNNPSPTLLQDLKNTLIQTIEELCRKGYIQFICGMNDGFDLLAASAILEVQRYKPLIELHAAIPFIGQEDNYSDQEKIIYHQTLRSANVVKVIYNNPTQQSDAHLLRNDFMIENSSAVVCYYDPNRNELRSGTLYNVRHAQKKNIPVINLF